MKQLANSGWRPKVQVNSMSMSLESNVSFSVVIPTCNRKLFAAQAIKSVQSQTFSAKEIIVVINGDSDGTESYLRELFDNLIVIVHPSNLGPSVARNTGIANASGSWVAFLDDDDMWHPEKLEVTAKYLAENPGAKAINCPAWYFSTQSGPEGMHGFKRDFIAGNFDDCRKAVQNNDPAKNSFDYLLINGKSFELLLERNRGLLSGTAVERTTLIRAGCFSPMHLIGEDWTCFLNIARLCEWHTIERRLVFYRLHDSQTCNTPESAMFLLGGLLSAWYTGFPTKLPARDGTFVKQLKAYGPSYRFFVQRVFWNALLAGNVGGAFKIAMMGQLLLPRFADLFYAALPPQFTWRFERYVLNMHRS